VEKEIARIEEEVSKLRETTEENKHMLKRVFQAITGDKEAGLKGFSERVGKLEIEVEVMKQEQAKRSIYLKWMAIAVGGVCSTLVAYIGSLLIKLWN
jgi:hypothetical protein